MDILSKIVNAIIKVEHIIYCATDCKVEFFLHRSYYNYRKERYQKYIQRHHQDWCC